MKVKLLVSVLIGKAISFRKVLGGILNSENSDDDRDSMCKDKYIFSAVSWRQNMYQNMKK